MPADGADKVPAKEGCSSRVQADLTVGSGRGKASLRPRSTKAEDGDMVTILQKPPYQPSNSGESTIPESRATGQLLH